MTEHSTDAEPADVPSREELDGRLDSIESWQENVFDGVLKPEYDAYENRIDELETRVDQLTAALNDATAQLETLSGLADDQESTPVLRNRDVYQSMLDRLVARDVDHYAMTYKEILDTLADKGHGSLHPPQAYSVIDDLAEKPGFSEGSKRMDETDQRAIRVNRGKLPFDPAVNEINNDWGDAASPQAVESATDD